METLHYLIGEQTPHMAWWQMCLRAVIIFAYAVSLYRLAPRRSFSNLSALDIVITVVLGSSLSRALTGSAPLLPTLVATALLVLLYAGMSALAPRSALLSRLVKGRPIKLIEAGEIDWQAMRRAQLGQHDITEQLRLNGVTDVSQVQLAHLERNGQISVVKR